MPLAAGRRGTRGGAVPDVDAGGDEGTVLLGAARCAGVSVGVGAGGVVVVVLGVGVGVVLGCAVAIPPPVVISIDAKAPMISDFNGDARFGRGKFRYFATLARPRYRAGYRGPRRGVRDYLPLFPPVVGGGLGFVADAGGGFICARGTRAEGYPPLRSNAPVRESLVRVVATVRPCA